MKAPFWKMSGAGNDFVLLAGQPKGTSGPALARRLCDRRRGVGADGLLILSRRAGRVRADYWNSDGSAAFCGNGSRCAALWAAQRRWVGARISLDTARGPVTARLTGKGRAEVSMPAPTGLALGKRLKVLARTLTVHFVDTGVPHAVVLVPDVEKVDVRALGRALRFHAAFGKAGANVDFVSDHGDRLSLRTYERGVEDETLACGTGVVAAAAVARALGHRASPVRVRVRGGEELTVSLDRGARLEGPGRVTFTGEIEL
ncbi:MAG: diaminopimelate epimerase [Elusimicrobia bacterium]|nr:diaminopimelate epimerase [Elusimicrobiota bacterium]